MATMSNINVRHRFTQVVVLVLLILAAVLFSQVANAGPKPKFDKPKYRTQVHRAAGRSCVVLTKKRKEGPGRPLLSSHRRMKKANSMALAETDGPGPK